MIEVIISTDCPFCEKQQQVLANFSSEEYRIIQVGSKEFLEHELRDEIEGVPFIILRENDKIRFAGTGFLNEPDLRAKMEKTASKPFNLHKKQKQ